MAVAESLYASQLEAVLCALCGSQEAEIVVKQERHRWPVPAVLCRECGLVYLNPRPTAAWYRRFFSGPYHQLYHGEGPVAWPGMDSEAAWRSLAALSWFGRQLRPTGRLLDVGCGDGLFLKQFRREFPRWSLAGIEPCEAYLRYARRQLQLENLQAGLFPEDLAPGEVFDLIHAGGALTHSCDPNAFLECCYRNLAPEGLLYLEVPNRDSPRRGARCVHVACLYYFNVAQLTAMVRKHGFEVLNVRDDVVCPHSSQPVPTHIQLLARRLELPLDVVPRANCDPASDLRLLRRRWHSGFTEVIRRKLFGA